MNAKRECVTSAIAGMPPCWSGFLGQKPPA